MKLYEFEAFPNPRRVRMFLAEKGIDVDRIQVNVPEGEHREETYRAINPEMTVPALKLDDGRVVGGCVAISRFVEAKYPDGALMGETPEEQGVIAAQQRRMETGLMDASTTYFHHATPGLGEKLETYQNADWGHHNAARAKATVAALEDTLASQDYVAGDRFTIADITAFVGLEFALFVKIVDLADYPAVAAWHARIGARPSAAA